MKSILSALLLLAGLALATRATAQSNTGVMTTDSAAMRSQAAGMSSTVKPHMQKGRPGTRGLSRPAKGVRPGHAKQQEPLRNVVPPGQEGKAKQIREKVKTKVSKSEKAKTETPDPMAIPEVPE